MKKIILITILFLLYTTFESNPTISIYATDSNFADCLLTGDYLPIEYINALKSFKAPIDAGIGLSFTLGRIEKEVAIYRISVGGYFDAVSLFISSNCKTPLKIEKYPLGQTFKQIDKRSFTIEENGKTIKFQYVGDVYSKWVAKTLFMGIWKDQTGNKFNFLSDNTVIVDGKKLDYDISYTYPDDFDGLFEDVLIIGTDQYAFQLLANTVKLYELHPPNIGEKPKYILKQLK